MDRKKYLFILICIFAFLFLIFNFYSPRSRAEEKAFLADGKKNPPSPPFDKGGMGGFNGEKIYPWYCAPCHGIKGDGKGFNAKNLDPRPTNHTNAELMSSRTNRELNEVIIGGGKSVGKSTLMPPWGNTLDKVQINSLVQYLRKLCKCEGE